MRNRLRMSAVAIFAAVAALSSSDVGWGQNNGRAVVVARHEIRSSLASAMADGHLSRREQYFILKKAKDRLPAAELRGLEQTLNRLARFKQTASAPQKLEAGTPVIVEPRIEEIAIEEPEIEELGVKEPRIEEPEIEEFDVKQAAGEERVAERSARRTTKQQKPPATFSALRFPGQKTWTKIASYDQSVDEPAVGEESAEKKAKVNPFKEESSETTSEIRYDEDFNVVGAEGDYFAGGYSFFDETCAGPRHDWNDIRMSATIDAFKGPLDLDNRNGNFGVRFAINGGFALYKPMGIGVQAGTSGVLADFHGTEFTADTIRSQSFTTAGFFQRLSLGEKGIKWGVAYDWMYDKYYTSFSMSQWRLKVGYEMTPCKEIGVVVHIPDRCDSAVVGCQETGFTVEQFRPVNQGSLYFNCCWETGAETTAWVGLCEQPGEIVFGGNARVPMSGRLAFVGDFNYILPSASSVRGQDEEQWNVSMGIELTLGRGENVCRTKNYAPFLPLANNGTFAFWRR